MKIISLFIIVLIIIISCKKETNTNPVLQKGISYPDTIYYGNNILNLPDSSILNDGIEYEMGAILQKDASLYLKFTNYSDTTGIISQQPIWAHSFSVAGWVCFSYNQTNRTQKFIATANSKNSVNLIFWAFGKTANCKIDFYENADTITRTKHFSWN